MKKRNIFLTVSLTLAAMQFTANAVTHVDENGLKFDLRNSDSTASFIGIDDNHVGSLTNLVIPSTVTKGSKEYTVTAVSDQCCYGNRTLRSLTIGENIKTIGKASFSSCASLSSVVFPQSLESIGVQAFYNCTVLSEVNLPSNLKQIDDFAFFYLPSLTTVTIPASVTILGKAPFGDCPALTAIQVEEENPNYVSVDGVLYSKDMTVLINYPIGDGVTSFTVPSTVTVIGGNSMRNNKVMTSVTFSSNLQTIEDGAFNYCVITAYNIPASVTKIGIQVFSGNDKLESFNVDPANPNYTSSEGVLLTKDMKKLLYGIAVADIIIPEGVETICDGAFYRYPAIKTLTLSSTVKTIEKSAFSTCSGLKTINFSSGLETIGLQAFYNCRALQDLTLPSSVRTLGSAAFAATGIKNLIIEEGLETIDANAFQACTNLRTAKLASTIKRVGEAMFYGDINLKECTLPEGIEKIGSSAFSSCTALKSITFPESLVEIENYAFHSAGIENLVLNEGLQTIGEGAFEMCSFPEVTLPASVKYVDYQGFSWNPNMTKFRCGAGLETLGANAVAGCGKLTDIDLNEGLQTIGSSAFFSCEALETLTIPSTVTSVGTLSLAVTPKLTTLKVLSLDPPVVDGPLYTDFYSGYDVVNLYVPEQSLDKYLTTAEWQNFLNIRGITDMGVENAEATDTEVIEIYDVNGLHRPVAGKGLNIYRMSDGSTKKVMK